MTLKGYDLKCSPKTGMGFIYSLCDPSTLAVRYIGQTKRSLYKRLKQHIGQSKNRQTTPVARWIMSLHLQGLAPKMVLLETTDLNNIDQREIYHITNGRAKYKLLNVSGGGKIEGRQKGHKLTEAQKQNKCGRGNNAFINYTGTWFNQLTVTGFSCMKNKISYWSCICDCGNCIIIGVNKIGRQKSCGCASKTRWDDDAKAKFSDYVNKNRRKTADGRFATNMG